MSKTLKLKAVHSKSSNIIHNNTSLHSSHPPSSKVIEPQVQVREEGESRGTKKICWIKWHSRAFRLPKDVKVIFNSVKYQKKKTTPEEIPEYSPSLLNFHPIIRCRDMGRRRWPERGPAGPAARPSTTDCCPSRSRWQCRRGATPTRWSLAARNRNGPPPFPDAGRNNSKKMHFGKKIIPLLIRIECLDKTNKNKKPKKTKKIVCSVTIFDKQGIMVRESRRKNILWQVTVFKNRIRASRLIKQSRLKLHMKITKRNVRAQKLY